MSDDGTADRALGPLPDDPDSPVTTTVIARVKPGHELFYEPVLSGIISAASRFPGHLGVEVFRPENASTDPYRIVYRFDTVEHLRTWLESGERAPWVDRAQPHLVARPRTQPSSPLSRSWSSSSSHSSRAFTSSQDSRSRQP